MKVYLEKCTADSFEDFYRLKCDEENIYWTGHKNKPDKEKMEKWYNNQLKRKDRIVFLAKEKNNVIGYLYLDITGKNGDICETGHGVYSQLKGKGIGTEIIRLALSYVVKNLEFINQVDGWILENNVGSIKNVLKNGYSETNEKKEILLESTGKIQTLKKYTYKIKR